MFSAFSWYLADFYSVTMPTLFLRPSFQDRALAAVWQNKQVFFAHLPCTMLQDNLIKKKTRNLYEFRKYLMNEKVVPF